MTVSKSTLRDTNRRLFEDHIWEATGKQVERPYLGRQHLRDKWKTTTSRQQVDKPRRQVGDNIWETISERHLRDNWDTTGGQVEDNRKTTGRQLGDKWKIVRDSGRLWETSGRHLGDRETTGTQVEDKWYTTSGGQLGVEGDNWKTTERQGFKVQGTLVDGRPPRVSIDWNKVEDKLGDKVGEKVGDTRKTQWETEWKTKWRQWETQRATRQRQSGRHSG